MKARVEPRTCNQKSRNTGCCRLLSLRPVLENVKGVKRKGSLCAGGLQCRFSEATTANAKQKSADMVVGRSESPPTTLTQTAAQK